MQRIILSIAIMILFAVGIFLGVLLLKKMIKKHAINKYKGTNDLVKYEVLEGYIKHQLKHYPDKPFSLSLISIDNFLQVKSYLKNEDVTNYLNELGKVIQMHLKKNWKFAQTKEREAFLIYSENLDSKDELYEILRKIKTSLENSFQINNDLTIHRTFTISFISYPDLGNTFDQLVGRLYASLLKAKKEGGNELITFNGSIFEDSESFNKYLNIKEGILNNDFEFGFLPIKDKNDKTLGYATEIYLKDSKGKLSYPDFIPNFEASQDAYWFSNWVFEKSIEEAFEVLTVNEDDKFLLFIPVSLQQLSNEKIVNRLKLISDKYQVKQSRIVLNIINTNTRFDDFKTHDNINKLKMYNFNISTHLNDNFKECFIHAFLIDYIFINNEIIESKKDILQSELNDVEKICISKNIFLDVEMNKMNLWLSKNSYLKKSDELFLDMNSHR